MQNQKTPAKRPKAPVGDNSRLIQASNRTWPPEHPGEQETPRRDVEREQERAEREKHREHDRGWEIER